MAKTEITERPAELPKPLSERARLHVQEVDDLQAEVTRQAAMIEQLERANLTLESECASLKISLESERAERRHYHSLANEIITRLDVVGRTVDDVVKRASQEVYRQRTEHPRADLPQLVIPEFLRQPIEGAAA